MKSKRMYSKTFPNQTKNQKVLEGDRENEDVKIIKFHHQKRGMKNRGPGKAGVGKEFVLGPFHDRKEKEVKLSREMAEIEERRRAMKMQREQGNDKETGGDMDEYDYEIEYEYEYVEVDEDGNETKIENEDEINEMRTNANEPGMIVKELKSDKQTENIENKKNKQTQRKQRSAKPY